MPEKKSYEMGFPGTHSKMATIHKHSKKQKQRKKIAKKHNKMDED